MDNTVFYNLTPLLQYQKPFSFIEGIRGRGKTYALKKHAINSFLKKGERTYWLRQNANHIRECKNNFFSDIAQDFEGYDFKVLKGYGYIKEADAKEWKQFIKFGCITVDSKTTSATYDQSWKWLIFDEYITMNNIDNLYIKYLIVHDTYARNREIRAIYASNNITKDNPFFKRYKITMNQMMTKEWIKGKNYIIHIDNKEASIAFQEAKLNSEAGKLYMSNGAYGGFAIKGEYIRDDDRYLRSYRHAKKKPLFIIDGYSFYEIEVDKEPCIYVSETQVIKELDYSFTTLWSEYKTYNIKHFPKVLAMIYNCIINGKIWYETPGAQSKVWRLFNNTRELV